MLRTTIILVGLIVLGPAHAAVPRGGAPLIDAETLTALPAARLARPLRTQRFVRASAGSGAAWQRFAAAAGPGWTAAWDVATGAPTRLWGPGLAAPGSIASADVAARFAQRVLAEHVALFAPGAGAGDFELVSNAFDGAQRSVGFQQRAGGRRVVGGQLSFRFLRDRLFVIACEALPDVAATEPRARRAASHDRALAELRRAAALPDAPAAADDEQLVLPLIGDAAVLGYRIVTTVAIDGGASGRYVGYTELATGELIALEQTSSFATGIVRYRGIDRHPARPRIDRAAARAHVMLGGAPVTTAPDGAVSWDAGVVPLTTTVVGDLAAIVNQGAGPAASAALSLSPGGAALWDPSPAPEVDAQVQVYVTVNRAKEFVRSAIAPGSPVLDEQLTANVNIADACNAFFDGVALNFFRASKDCQNTGLVEDVVIHEFGHRLHRGEIIPGVGAFDKAISEGAADFLAATMLDDAGMGRGFHYDDTPVRNLDPGDREAIWPEGIGEVHQTGLIYAGALWDLRKALIAALGRSAGLALVHRLYLATLRRASDIPSSLIEALAADDDDGDLANGTPHECAIREAFARHGLRLVGGTVTVDPRDPSARRATVRVVLTGLSERCATDPIDRVVLDWGASGDVAAGSTPAAPAADQWSAELPLAIHAAMYYRVTAVFAGGTTLRLPDNRADPYYQLYQGPVVALYCTDFDHGDPFAEGWTTGTGDGSPSPWSWGAPHGGAHDPAAAFSGQRVVGLALDGAYPASAASWIKLPPIDVGQWSDVRLQYRRWLTVEDRARDQARITVGDQLAWTNATDHMGGVSGDDHIDREWRFHDVGVSGKVSGHELVVGWDLRSDDAVQLGGWNLDDVCVIANPDSMCGDGVRSPTEACDDGAANADRANACRTWCALPRCGDGIIDASEQCDDGPNGSERCSYACELFDAPAAGGCSSSRGAGSLAGVLAVLGLLRRRSRRARPHDRCENLRLALRARDGACRPPPRDA